MPIQDRETIVITNTGIEFKALAEQYPTVESFRQAIINKQVNYAFATPTSTEHATSITYQVSDFGTEEVTYLGSTPKEKLLYQLNLRDKLQKLPTVNELDAQIEEAVEPKLDITAAEEQYAKKDGYYSTLGAGLADNLRATIGSTDNNTVIFRSSGGSADISDGYAEITSIKGNSSVSNNTFINSNITGIKTIGFNQWNGEYIHVLPSSTFNHYCISGTRTSVVWYDTLEHLRAGTGGITLTIQTGTNSSGDSYNYFVVTTEGYVKIVGAGNNTCVSFVWSGYRVTDTEEYWTSTLNIDVTSYFPTGMKKANLVYDELTGTRAIKRIGVDSFIGTENITTEADSDPLYVKYVVEKTISGIKLGNNNLSTIANVNSITATSTSIKFRVLLTDYATTETFRAALTNSSLNYELATEVITPLEYNLNYQVSDFGTEEVLYTNLAPSLEVIFYQMNLRDKLQRLPGASELQTSLDSKLNVSTAESDYAKQRGNYPFLNSGTADNLNATIGTTDDAVWTLRTTGGTTSVNDGFANITSVNGVNNGTNVKSLKTIGFNAFDKSKGYAFVLGGKEYCVSGTYTSLGFTTTVGGTTTPISTTTATTSSGVEYQSYTPTENGYIYVTNPSTYMCISLVWSGYRVTDYEDYWEDNLTINSKNYFPEGMYKAKNAYDELNSQKAIKRINGYTFTGTETLTQTSTTKEVPAEYEQEEYIEATGTQWLDTGLNPTSALGNYRFEFKYASTASASYNYAIGCSSPNVYWGFNNASINTNLGAIYPDGTPVAGNNIPYRVIVSLSSTGSYTYALFGYKNGASTATYFGKGRMYYCNIYQLNNTTGEFDLIKRFIPAKRLSDNVLGMYETVGQTFITNSGTGEFTTSTNTVHFYNTYSTTNSDFDIRANTVNMIGESTSFNYGQVDVSDVPSGYTRLESINFNQFNNTIGYGNGFTFPYTITQIKKVILDVQAWDTNNAMILASATSTSITPNTASPYISMTGQNGHSSLTRTVSTVAGFYSRVQAEFTWTTSSNNYLTFGHWNAESGWPYKGKVFGIKLYSDAVGTTLLADYIPAKRNSDNKVGLYDKKSGDFIVNLYDKPLGYTLKTLENGNNIYGNLTNLYIQAYDVNFPTTASILSELNNKYIRWEKSQYEEQTSSTELRYRISDFGLEELVLETGAANPDLTVLYQVNLRDTVQRSIGLLDAHAEKLTNEGEYTIKINNSGDTILYNAPKVTEYNYYSNVLGSTSIKKMTIDGNNITTFPYLIDQYGSLLRIGSNAGVGYGFGSGGGCFDIGIGNNFAGNNDCVTIGEYTTAASGCIALGEHAVSKISSYMTMDGTTSIYGTGRVIPKWGIHFYSPDRLLFRYENVSANKTSKDAYTNNVTLADLTYHKKSTLTSNSSITLEPSEYIIYTAQNENFSIIFDNVNKLPDTISYAPEYNLLLTTASSCIGTFPTGIILKTNDESSAIINQNIVSFASGKTFEISIQNNLGLIYVW